MSFRDEKVKIIKPNNGRNLCVIFSKNILSRKDIRNIIKFIVNDEFVGRYHVVTSRFKNDALSIMILLKILRL